MKIVGITGPSGSGKTLFTKYFCQMGVPTVDADEVYHSMLIPPSECLDAIRENFGDTVFCDDGTLNRVALGAVVFNDSEALKLLNSTVLGMVLDRIRKMISEAEARGETVIIIDGPTLIESGFHRECDTVISVIAPTEDRIRRIMERDGISEEKARERVRAQKDDSFYKDNSNAVLYNDSTADDFLTVIKSVESDILKI